MAGGVARALRSLSADEIAERCERLGARVEIRGAKWWIYPPDRPMSPVSFSRLAGHLSGNGTAQANLISDLRKRGLDLLEEARAEQNIKPRPPDTAPEEPKDMTESTAETPTANGTPIPYSVDGTTRPFDYRKAYKDLADQAKTLDATVSLSLSKVNDQLKRRDGDLVSMVAEQEGRITDNAREQDRRIRELAGRVKALEQLLARGEVSVVAKAPAPPSKPELLRRAVLAFYSEHRGLKLSPMAVRANIEGDETLARMLAVMPPTAVAGACRELVKAGHLMGGGKTGGPMNANHGVYWMPVAEAKTNGKKD